MYSLLFDEIFNRPESCVICYEDIGINDKQVLVHIFDNHVTCWVHAGKCCQEYKKLLDSPEAIKEGCIFGVCAVCARPVRSKQHYILTRMSSRCAGDYKDSESINRELFTTMPLPQCVDLCHYECNEQL